MKKNLTATSIIEAIVVLLIVMMAITSAYNMFTKALKVTDSNGYKLQAISIAKEGIEAMTNIRDTNWKVLPGDYTNCWNTFNYTISCHNDTGTSHDIKNNTSYTIWKDNTDQRWKLSETATGNYTDSGYRSRFQVGYDTEGFFTGSGALFDSSNPLSPIFTREIKIKYLDDGYTGGAVNSNHQKMQVTSLVQWVDQSSDSIRKVEIITTLTNWRNNN